MSFAQASSPACVAVACSGGRDSIALLHATASAARDVPGLAVVALHVHHGLSAQADHWAGHVQAQCDAWAAQGLPVSAVVRRVQCVPAGRSLEAVAREARYAALAEMALQAGADLVLLAHHRRDQAETVLLQALRGGGVAALAAMPASAQRHGVRWCRPWLDHPREAVEAYVQAHDLAYVDDDSNADLRFSRNRVRADVWPALQQAFPQVEAALAASARRVSDAQAVLDGALDHLVRALCVPDAGPAPALNAQAWSLQDGPHRRLTLLHWYRQRTGRALPATWIDRLADEVPVLLARGAASSWPPVGLGLYRGMLDWTPDMAVVLATLAAQADESAPSGQDWFFQSTVRAQGRAAGAVPRETQVGFAQALSVPLPGWGGNLVAEPVPEQGVPWALLCQVNLRPRQGGEQFQAGPNRPARALRKQYQQFGVAAWLREGPLAWLDDTLLFVPGLGMDARFWAPQGAPQWALRWQRTSSVA